MKCKIEKYLLLFFLSFDEVTESYFFLNNIFNQHLLIVSICLVKSLGNPLQSHRFITLSIESLFPGLTSYAYIIVIAVCSCANLLHLCPTLCDPIDHRPPGSTVHEILLARILEWIATLSSRVFSQPKDRIHISYIYRIAGRFLTKQL